MPDLSKSYRQYKFQPEYDAVGHLIQYLQWDQHRSRRVKEKATRMVEAMREQPVVSGSLESFAQKFGLNTEEGTALMCLAEALLRIPDAYTANALIQDKVLLADWVGKNDSGRDWIANFAGFGLAVTKKTLSGVLARLGGPIIRQAMKQAMRMLGEQFVVGETIGEALNRARIGSDSIAAGTNCSFDMLGEGARTHCDAERYFDAYWQAIEFIGQDKASHGISVKLSALYPRYEYAHREQCIPSLITKMRELCRLASTYDMDLTIDAEETDRLDLSLEIIDALSRDDALRGWNGLGLALQAYHKQAFHIIDLLYAMAKRDNRQVKVRLVKGAYWDTEIKRAQVKGFKNYPVYTRKAYTDLSYLACARKLLSYRDHIYPMFATHNAHTVSAILDLEHGDASGMGGAFEFQRLYGMGHSLYQVIEDFSHVRVRVYAPVGTHTDLLPYLVRRLLENGANSSFVYKLNDLSVSVASIVVDPVEKARSFEGLGHPQIALPADIYGSGRRNSQGLDFSSEEEMSGLEEGISKTLKTDYYEVSSFVAGVKVHGGRTRSVHNPACISDVIGEVRDCRDEDIERAFMMADFGYHTWRCFTAHERAKILRKFADLLEEQHETLIGLCVREAGKTLYDSHLEIREAVDFARYYAMMGEKDFCSGGMKLPGVTGEDNRLYLEGRGVFVCISPWNFPVAIFCGQVLAALMAGNSVIAKPAEQTCIVASKIAELLYQAGVPRDVFSLLLGGGEVGASIVAHDLVAGVAFTGSTDVAKSIQKTLASKKGAIVPLIAETGGQNAMIVDSSSLPEQVVDDVIMSGFGSAGQRCSALRILCLQKEISETILEMLKGAMNEIQVGDPALLSTDVGPVIDETALAILRSHKTHIQGFGEVLNQVPMDSHLEEKGYFFSPMLVRIQGIESLEREIFGPVIHVYIYRAHERDELIQRLNSLGYGLTFGIHSRIGQSIQKMRKQIVCGNVYINRSMTGAVVGSQPFGGCGLSGTGPKAGGPFYLHRFATEKAVSDNVTARGGNLDLINLGE